LWRYSWYCILGIWIEICDLWNIKVTFNNNDDDDVACDDYVKCDGLKTMMSLAIFMTDVNDDDDELNDDESRVQTL